MTKLTYLPHNQPTRLKNVRCAYCNAEFTGNEPEKEHVIGKNFVPRGSHNQWWNLHLNSCHNCNQIKSKLETDLSAITMLQPLVASEEFDEDLAKEADRKSKRAISVRTRKPVKDSAEQIKIKHEFGPGLLMTFGFTTGPQADRTRLFQLARYQLAGFYYLMSYDESAQLGKYWVGEYMPVDAVPKRDWGNANITSFARATSDWTTKFGGPYTSNGYYRVLIKQSATEPLWSWAIEWNKQHRLYGFIGDPKLGKEVATHLDKNIMSEPIKDGDATYRARVDVPVGDSALDRFFDFDEEGP